MIHAVSGIFSMAQFAAYGLAGAFLLALLERLVPVVPSYGLFIFLGSALVVRPLDLLPLIVVATLASTLSALCWYGIGHALGEVRTRALVKRYGCYVGLRESLYLSLAGRYSRNAFIATFMGQTIPVVRCYLSLPAAYWRCRWARSPSPCWRAARSGSAASSDWAMGFTSSAGSRCSPRRRR